MGHWTGASRLKAWVSTVLSAELTAANSSHLWQRVAGRRIRQGTASNSSESGGLGSEEDPARMQAATCAGSVGGREGIDTF